MGRREIKNMRRCKEHGGIAIDLGIVGRREIKNMRRCKEHGYIAIDLRCDLFFKKMKNIFNKK